MKPLRISLVQAATIWHDAEANRNLYGDLIRPLAGNSDLILLPETFTSGFSNDAAGQAENMDGASVDWMRRMAGELGSVICGSLVIREGDAVFNRLIWMRPDGSHAQYDKRHLFRMAGEHQRYAAGKERLIVDLLGWRVCPQVCYDLRFPVYLRNRFDSASGCFDYDLLLFVANWPERRREPWRTLLRARAMENLACVAAVNRVGVDGNELSYSGDSAIIDGSGRTLIELGPETCIASHALDPEALLDWRMRFPAHMDADDFTLHD